jgi:hypothetical protein
MTAVANVLLSIGLLSQAAAPSIEETKAWIESEGPRIMDTTTHTRLGEFKSSVSNLRFDTSSCRITWTMSNGLRASVPMADLDTGGLVVSAGTLFDAQTHTFTIKTRATVGPTIDGWYESKPKKVSEIAVDVVNQVDGDRLANAFKHAAILCGAPQSAF